MRNPVTVLNERCVRVGNINCLSNALLFSGVVSNATVLRSGLWDLALQPLTEANQGERENESETVITLVFALIEKRREPVKATRQTLQPGSEKEFK